MPSPQEDLSQIANEIDQLIAKVNAPEILATSERLVKAHASLGGVLSSFHIDPIQFSRELADRDTKALMEYNEKLKVEFKRKREAAISILTIYMDKLREIKKPLDGFLDQKMEELGGLSLPIPEEIIMEAARSERHYWGEVHVSHSPHHILLTTAVIRVPTAKQLEQLAEIARQCADHLSRKQSYPQERRASGPKKKVFIGHGHSPDWLKLQNYIQKQGLEVEEFDGIPTAGMSISDRLSQMLDNAGFALLVMTGEEKQPDGTLRTRLNVVHESGLFQGRLGFTKAIILLEDGCEGFSNIAGLKQIRFPKGKIESVFHEVRAVLEREGLL
ncbi:MAG: nucleotide-binding protein [Alphaproteobacteria bacterium]|nr:nucleotide-binding protein [Alphaproteobacteria bacterium]MDA8003596.1 nucleotide-binding protein [Alphaproteobacteria bacterium]MDA8005287.1 nucleotide-binding protein [Alphaproteobacteria bacterium]MDA8012843.1 nucleotide-binding protein [Alphaproteobacteria bacterium]